VEAIARGAGGGASLLAVAGRAPDFVRPDMLIEDVAALMLATGRDSVVVVVEGEPVGLLRLPAVIGALLGGSSWIGALRIALHIERPLP
jgi:CBS domain-containing protein